MPAATSTTRCDPLSPHLEVAKVFPLGCTRSICWSHQHILLLLLLLPHPTCPPPGGLPQKVLQAGQVPAVSPTYPKGPAPGPGGTAEGCWQQRDASWFLPKEKLTVNFGHHGYCPSYPLDTWTFCQSSDFLQDASPRNPAAHQGSQGAEQLHLHGSLGSFPFPLPIATAPERGLLTP